MSDQTVNPTSPSGTFLAIGIGTIDPSTRVEQGLISDQVIDQLASWLRTPEAYQKASDLPVPTQCVDGRSRKDGLQSNGYNAAGGTFSLVMADALSHGSYRRAGESAAVHARHIYEQLLAEGFTIGGHDDTSAVAPACGCGAEDKLDSKDLSKPSILRYIANHGRDIRQTLDTLSINVKDALHIRIIENSKALVKEGYATNGRALRQVIIDLAGSKAIVTLDGDHQEVALVINTETGTTLDRRNLTTHYGVHYQVFNLDVPAIEAAAKIISFSVNEAHEKFIAALYYNLATTAILAGPSLRLIVRE
jgi:hypothetical protein